MMKHSSGNNASVMLVVMVMVSLVAIALVGSSAQAAVIPPPHCSPEVADALSPRLRRICAALYGMAEISGAVEQYLDERTAMSMPLVDGTEHGGVKRQDVDHVFLRFGRR